MTQMKNKIHGFTITVAFPEQDALRSGVSLEHLAKIASDAIVMKAPRAKLNVKALLTDPTMPSNIVWDNRRKSLIVNKVEVRLTRSEVVVMSRLAESANEYVSYPELLSTLETEVRDIGSPSNLRVLLHRLRKKFGSDGSVIATDREYGYSLRTNDGRLTLLR